MSFFEDASLVLIPSAQKLSKIYSVKPTDGTGDLTFTRSNATATRVGPDGLIEKVRTNLATYSEDFTNAAWTKIYATVTGNSVANPLNGATTADTITPTTDVDVHRFRITSTGLSAGQTYTFSFYAKANGYNFVRIIENTTTGDVKQFNLSNGTIDTGSLSGQIVSLGNGWYRCAAQIVAASSQTIDVQIQSMAGTQGAFAGNGTSGVYVFGAQLELSDFGATDYIATTSAAVSVGPVANVPRLDYLNSSCPRLLLEGQRQNILNFSESFDNAYWNKAGTTITANNTISPDGYTNADRLTSSGAGNDEYIQRAGLSTTAGTYTSSIFVKNVNATQTVLMAVHLGEGSVTSDLRYTWSTGAFTINGTNAVSGKATSYGNGWVRLEFTYTIGASVSGHWFRTYVQTGVSTNSIFIYGASVELGSYPTSYIPTLGAAVTRGADGASKTGISSLIGQTEGTLFVEVDYSTLSGLDMFLSIRPNASNKVEVYRDGANIYGEINGSSNFAIFTSKAVGTHKIAFAYKSGSSALYIDGALVNQNTTSFTFSATLADLFINQRSGGTFIEAANYKQALLFKTRLTNAQLAELTTI